MYNHRYTYFVFWLGYNLVIPDNREKKTTTTTGERSLSGAKKKKQKENNENKNSLHLNGWL